MKLWGSGGYVPEIFAVDFKTQLDNSIWGGGEMEEDLLSTNSEFSINAM
jgi:hypothetical protein